MIVFPMRNSAELGRKVARHAGTGPGKDVAGCAKAELGRLETGNFPDGELYLRFMDEVAGKRVVLVQSMHPQPNDALVSVLFAARTAKELGAEKVTAVIPYLGYMRQDNRFNSGECVSNRVMATFLNQVVDRIVTIDPHMHRVKALEDLFHIERKKLSANEEIAKHIKSKFSAKASVVAGPDIESSQWAKAIADSIGFESVIFMKERFSSRHVKISVTREPEWKGKDVIIVDDIISSGHTMIEAVKEVRKRKPRAIHVICVHPIFVENAYAKILRAGARSIVSCNTILHNSNAIDLSGLIAKEL